MLERPVMFPRGTPDIEWRDLCVSLLYTVWPGKLQQAHEHVISQWNADRPALACLSVRSGFDLVLRDLALPAGSEILVSAVTISGMVQIIQHHGLTPVPLDVDFATLAIDPAQLAAAIGPRTKAILVAHLFGGRMPLDAVIAIARVHDLVVIEDCAQAYDASRYCGHPDSDVSMFSFGPIKTATALGGAMLCVNNHTQRDRLEAIQAGYPVQRRRAFVRRVLQFMLLKALANPPLFGLLVAACQRSGHEHDQLIYRVLRGFQGTNLMTRIRYQPALPLLRLLARRFRQRNQAGISERTLFAQRVRAALPTANCPGTMTAQHTHWVIPCTSRDPDALVQVLWAHGFDATRNASSLVAVASQATDTTETQRWLAQLVYLPTYRALPTRAIEQLGQLVYQFEQPRAGHDENTLTSV